MQSATDSDNHDNDPSESFDGLNTLVSDSCSNNHLKWDLAAAKSAPLIKPSHTTKWAPYPRRPYSRVIGVDSRLAVGSGTPGGILELFILTDIWNFV